MDDLARFIAKIGHAYAVAMGAMDPASSLIRPAILGDDPNLSFWVGSSPHAPERAAGYHRLGLVEDARHLLAVVQLFGAMGLPAYEAVVGRIMV